MYYNFITFLWGSSYILNSNAVVWIDILMSKTINWVLTLIVLRVYWSSYEVIDLPFILIRSIRLYAAWCVSIELCDRLWRLKLGQVNLCIHSYINIVLLLNTEHNCNQSEIHCPWWQQHILLYIIWFFDADNIVLSLISRVVMTDNRKATDSAFTWEIHNLSWIINWIINAWNQRKRYRILYPIFRIHNYLI